MIWSECLGFNFGSGWFVSGHRFPRSSHDTNGLITPYIVHHIVFTLSTGVLMNVPISIAMAAQIPVVIFETISIAMFVKNNKSLQSLTEAGDHSSCLGAAGCVRVCHSFMSTTAAGDHRLLHRFRKCSAVLRNYKCIFLSPLASLLWPHLITMCSHISLEFKYNWFNARKA